MAKKLCTQSLKFRIWKKKLHILSILYVTLYKNLFVIINEYTWIKVDMNSIRCFCFLKLGKRKRKRIYIKKPREGARERVIVYRRVLRLKMELPPRLVNRFVRDYVVVVVDVVAVNTVLFVIASESSGVVHAVHFLGLWRAWAWVKRSGATTAETFRLCLVFSLGRRLDRSCCRRLLFS